MGIKRLLSVILCLVFVMSLFPLSGAAKSDRFVANDEQDISVSEVVYAEQGNDIDNGIYPTGVRLSFLPRLDVPAGPG